VQYFPTGTLWHLIYEYNAIILTCITAALGRVHLLILNQPSELEQSIVLHCNGMQSVSPKCS
jgi:hypothetical protein